MPKSRENKLQSRFDYTKLMNEGKPASSFSQLTYLLHLVTALNSNDNLQSAFFTYRRSEGKPNIEGDYELAARFPLGFHSCNLCAAA